ncbi:MAG: FAD:protein FMN transferase [Chloroflexi bacterium]|nr:MAG: FAD:protein FMN transferase [Chloroflexota bacterium]
MRPDGPVASHHFEALGTSCSLFAGGQSRTRLLEGEFWVRRLGARLTRFSTDSELSRLNRNAGQWTGISDEMEVILRAALHAHEMSAGLVNAAVLPSMLAVGYTRPFAEGPTVALLDGARPLPPLREVLEVRAGVACVHAGCGIDLGGIAKGWMADRLCEMLGPNAIANLGGDLRAVGPGPAGDGWPVVEAEVVAKTALLLGPDFAPAYCAAHAMAWWLAGPDDD